MVKLVTAISIVVLSLVVILTAGFIWNKSVEFHQSENQNRVRIESKTPALAVQSLREVNTTQYNTIFEIALRNVSPKPISALTLKIEDAQTGKNDLNLVTEGGLFSYWSLQPNETKNIRFSTSPTGNVTLIIAAVIFADGETNGDAFFTEDLQNRKSGVKLAYQRILPILRRSVNPQATDISDETTQTMLNEIKSIDEKSVPQNLLGGFLDGKRDITSDIEYSLKERERKRNNPQFKLKDRLQKIGNRVEMALSKP